MPWQLIAIFVISAASLVAFFAMRGAPSPLDDRVVEDEEVTVDRLLPAQQPDPDTVRRFLAALKSDASHI